MRAPSRSIQWQYFAKEAVLFLLLTYLTLFGATFNGVIQLPLIQANLVLIAGIGAAWLIWRLVRRKPFPVTSLEIPWLLLIAAYALATAFSADPRRSAPLLARLVLYALIFYLVVDLVRAGWPADLFLKTFIFTSSFLILFNMLQIGLWVASWIQTAGWSDPIPPQPVRISAFLGHGNFIGAYFNLLLPLLAVRWLQPKSKGAKTGWAAWYLLGVVMMAFSLSRGGWIGSMAGRYGLLALLALAYRDELTGWWKAGRGRWKAVALAAGGLVLVTAFDLAVLSLQTNHPSHVAATSATITEIPDLSVNRGYIWKVAVEMLKDHPILGNGPFTFGTRFIESNSIPPGMILAHAHNVVLQVAAETGMVGMAALLVLIAAFLHVVVRRWKATQGTERLVLIGLLAALVGFGVHSLFDTPEQLPLFCILAAILGAVLAAENEPEKAPRFSPSASALLALAWVAVAGAFAWYVWSYTPFNEGVDASARQDWRSAAQQLDLAVERDPALAFNWFQAGMAHGELALAADGSLADRGELDRALADFRRGLAIEPGYATNWANRAALEWAGGDRDAALASIRRAAGAANNQPFFRLTLARMLEESGKIAEAGQEYGAVLAQRPDWVDAYFFRATLFRRQLAGEWKSSHPAQAAPAEELESLSARELRTAGFSQANSADNAPYLLALANAYRREGKTAEAIQTYETLLDQLEQTSSFGLGQLDNPQYGWYIFDRQSIAADLLPGVDTIVYTDPVVEGMVELAGLYERAGRAKDGGRVWEKILKVAPDTGAAQEGMENLKTGGIVGD
ncbi:MAG TPA: O-antigen ligase family protein [Anaerolineaceae bacterium]|nr:O-antigen ligase family protein [Anaerolineaceae bacterium]